MPESITVREWEVEAFHQRILKLEAEGYVTRLESYEVTPEMNPETGEIIHLYAIELCRPVPA